MPIIRNGFGNCQSDLLGSGRFFCDTETLGNLKGVILHAKGTGRYPVSGDLKTLIQNDIKNLRAFPYLDLNGFENSHEENQMNTSNLGKQSITRLGLPAFTYTFTRGSQQQKSLANKNGNGKWDYTLVFENGLLRAFSTDGITSEPFEGNVVSVSNLNLLNGTDLQGSNVMIQLANYSQYNERNDFLSYADNSMSENDIEGVIETNMNFATPPSAGDTVTLTLTSAGNRDSFINLFDQEANYRATVIAANGANVSTTVDTVAINTDTQQIQLTLTPDLIAGQKVRIELTSTLSGNVYPVAVDDDNKFFKGRTPLTTVVA